MHFLRYILFLIFISVAICAVPQSFKGGITAGLVGSQVAGDNFAGYNKAGIFAGGWVSLDISERIGAKMELTYFQKGSRENPTEKNDYEQFLLRLNYIEMPVLLQYKINRFTIEAGPSVGILVGSYVESNEWEYDFSDEPKSLTVQINLGLQYNIAPQFGVGLRTNNSLWNVFYGNKNGDVWRFWDYGWYNDSLVIYASYQF